MLTKKVQKKHLVIKALLVVMVASGVFFTSIQSSSYAVSRMQQAMEFFKSGQFDNAIQLLEQLHLQSPNEPDVINNLAATYVQRGNSQQESQHNLASAALDFRAALYLLAYEWPDGLVMDPKTKGNIAIAEDNLKSVYAGFNVAANDFNWHLNAAKTFRSRGQLMQAFVEYAEASKIKPADVSAWEGQGDIYTVRRRYNKAVKIYEKALQASGNTPNVNLLIKTATAYQQTDTPEKANALFSKVLTIEPNNVDALLALEQLWRQELQLNPNNNTAHINLGSVYQQMKRFNEADKEYHIAFAMDPNNQVLKQNIASLYHDQGQDDKSLAFYDELILQNPNNYDLYRTKATLLKDQGKIDTALQVMEQSLPYAPSINDKKPCLPR
mgnify:CR=1 FL=1